MACLAGSLALTACDEDRLTREDFIAAADAICDEIEERTKDLEVPRTPPEIQEFVTEARSAIRDLVAQIRDLRPPEEDEEAIGRFLDDLEGAADLLPDIAEASESRDIARVGELVRTLQEKAGAAGEFARDYGFDSCAEAGRIGGTEP